MPLKPSKEVGKKSKKDDILDAKVGRTWVTPKNRHYQFDYTKDGNKYIFIVIYKGHRMRCKESDFNKMNIDDLIDIMEKEF